MERGKDSLYFQRGNGYPLRYRLGRNLIFDLVVDGSKLTKEITEELIKEEVTQKIQINHPTYRCIIVIDRMYS